MTMQPPSPVLVARARWYIAHARWTFAKTMPENPHWYAVRERAWAKSEAMGQGHEALFVLLRDHHIVREWHGKPYRTLDIDEWSYWIMQIGTVINRKPVSQAGWDKPRDTLF